MKHWHILNPLHEDKADKSELDLQTFCAVLLQNRKLETKESIEAFLYPKLENIELEKMGVGADVIAEAKKLIKRVQKEGKSIVIYGDYDVDGICASAILWETFYSSYKKTIPYIPHRVNEGYGLSITGVDNIL